MTVLVLASTFPASVTDAVPAFVRDQVVALKRVRPDWHFAVLAPHYGTRTASHVRHEHFDEHRFRYFFPGSLQTVAGAGIVPSIEKNPLLVALLPFFFVFQLLAVLRLARRLRPDVIYAHWFTPQGVTAAIASMLTGIPWVLTSHSNDVRAWSKIPWAGRWVVRRCLPRARRITAVSRPTLEKMKGFFSDPEWEGLGQRVAIIPMGVDVAELTRPGAPAEELKERYGYAGRKVVLFMGRLAPKKGLDYLVEAVATMDRSALPPFVVVIAGTGPLADRLHREVRVRGLSEWIVFAGYVAGEEKRDHLEMADVVVVPSIETASGDAEGFPVVVLEAMAAGVPCVVSDATGADVVVASGTVGFVVPQRDAGRLASAVAEALTLDADRRLTIRRSARTQVGPFDWEPIAERHARFLFDPANHEPPTSRAPDRQGGAV